VPEVLVPEEVSPPEDGVMPEDAPPLELASPEVSPLAPLELASLEVAPLAPLDVVPVELPPPEVAGPEEPCPDETVTPLDPPVGFVPASVLSVVVGAHAAAIRVQTTNANLPLQHRMSTSTGDEHRRYAALRSTTMRNVTAAMWATENSLPTTEYQGNHPSQPPGANAHIPC